MQNVVTLRLPTGVNVIVIWVDYLREVGLGSSTQSDRGVTFCSLRHLCHGKHRDVHHGGQVADLTLDRAQACVGSR